ncbi:MAG: HAD family hydrolase [Desulforhopalus sp.]
MFSQDNYTTFDESTRAMNHHTLQAVFFDFDGVIVDSNRVKTEAFCKLFGDYNDDIIDQVVEYHRQHGGISRVEKIDYAHRHIIKKSLTPEKLAQWASTYSRLVTQKVIEAEWIAGAQKCLDYLHGRVAVFVISGTPEEELKYVIGKRKMSGYFDEILGSPTRKPEHIRHLLAQHLLAPRRCVFVGDALTDHDAAKETGLHFIGIQGEVPFPVGTKVLPDCTELLTTMEEIFCK